MKAMILAAGLGTRLRPLTDTRPKALVEINNRTLLEIILTRLRTCGITEAIINVHHFADMVEHYLKAKNNFNMRIEISREDDQLLDTGGGLKKAAWFFQESPSRADSSGDHSVLADKPFLLHNVDVISTIDLAAMLEFHTAHQALATLAVQSRDSGRQLLFNDQLQLSGRHVKGQSPLPESTTLSALHPFAFSGIHIISPRLLPLLTETGPFSIIDFYLRLASQGEKIVAFRHDNSYWRDLGKPADLAQAREDLHQKVAF
jgi:NDP-sugar pyrophosphorylase family protein